jgi:hypothetical protein
MHIHLGVFFVKKLCVVLSAAVVLMSVSAAFAHGHSHGGGNGHVWRNNNNGGYYCAGGYGHGSHCVY